MARAAARHILVETEEQCNDLKNQIAAGADFAELAKEHSKCPSGKSGGDLGEFGQGQMVPQVFGTAALDAYFQGQVKLGRPLGQTGQSSIW